MSKLSRFIDELNNGKELHYGSKDYDYCVNEWCVLDFCMNDVSFTKNERSLFIEYMQILHDAFSKSESLEFN